MIQLILVSAVSVLMIILDRITKNWAISTFVDGDIIVEGNNVLYSLGEIKEIPVIKDVLYFKFIPNTGVAFSLFADESSVFIIVLTCILLAICIYYLFSGKISSTVQKYCLGLIISGGIGNLIDRMTQGYVTDFIDVRIINFAIFNVADICISCGALLLCLSVLLEDLKKKKATVPAGEDTNE